jgi:hypothetical protein
MPYPVTQEIRAERRAKAEARQAETAMLSLDERIAQQEKFKGKEYHRLVKLRDAPPLAPVEAPVEQPKRLTAEQKAARKAEHKAQAKQVK